MTSLRQLCERASEAPEAYWGGLADAIYWDVPAVQVFDRGARPLPRWFSGGQLNAAWNCVDRHVEAGYGSQLAVAFESAVTQSRRTLTYSQLQDAVSRFAGVLSKRGVELGDRVIIYMPNSPEAVIAMLACARIGAIHSVVFGGFAAAELASRIDDSQPRLIVAASCGIEGNKIIAYQPIVDAALAMAGHSADHVIFWQREQCEADLGQRRPAATLLNWATEIATAEPVGCVPVDAHHPLYILYTSGTTGQPKGIVRDTAGYPVALQWTMNAVYACPPGQTFWAASDVGWVVGHSYIVYGPLLNRNTTVIFEGKPVGTPDAGVIWRTIGRYGVHTFFTAPTAIRAIRQIDPAATLMRPSDLVSLSAIFLAGERTDPDTLVWLAEHIGVPLVDHWWQTETGWPICANPLGIETQTVPPGSTGPALPGWQIECVDVRGVPVAAGTTGALVARLPLPPGAAPTLWNAPERFVEAYLTQYPGCYQSGDAGFIDDNGHVHVMSRTDDVINVAGHRLSSSAIEEVLAAHGAVAECAVIGAADALKGQVPMGFVVLTASADIDTKSLQSELIADVRAWIGPVAAFHKIHVVSRLPKTRSGKILRRTLRSIADGEEAKIPPTIEDAAVLDEFHALFSPTQLPS
jgi:propionyl-CoA synthetase